MLTNRNGKIIRQVRTHTEQCLGGVHPSNAHETVIPPTKVPSLLHKSCILATLSILSAVQILILSSLLPPTIDWLLVLFTTFKWFKGIALEYSHMEPRI
jgi:hypothetical protein